MTVNSDLGNEDAMGRQVREGWPKPTGTCQRCSTRPATEVWSAGGTMAFIHGDYSYWCKLCVLEEQLKHAKEQAARVTQIEAEIITEKAKLNE